MAAKSNSKYASQAARDALLRFNPQRETIADLQREAEEQFTGSVAGAESTGRLTSAAIEKAKPDVSAIFDRASSSSGATQATLASALSALGVGANGFKAAAATESAAGNDRLARSRASAEDSLTQQDVSAKSAPAYAQTLAGQQLLKTLGKLSGERQSIAGQEGAATASEIDSLENEAAGRHVTERGQNLSAQSGAESRAQKAKEHQEDLADKRQARAESGTSGGEAKPLTRKEQNDGAATIRQIRQFAAEGGGSRAERVAALTEGRPSQSGETKDGQKVKTPSIPAFKPDVLMSAALDWSEYGHLRQGTERRLKQEGYNVAALGIPRATKTGEGVRKTGDKIKSAATGF